MDGCGGLTQDSEMKAGPITARSSEMEGLFTGLEICPGEKKEFLKPRRFERCKSLGQCYGL